MLPTIRESDRASSPTDRKAVVFTLLLSLWPVAVHAAGNRGEAAGARDEAAALSAVAATKAKAGEFALCASLFHEAYRKDPAFLGYLYSAARCEQKAGDLDAAERDYRQFLARSAPGAQLTDKAKENLDEILEARKNAPVPPTSPNKTAPSEVPPVQDPRPLPPEPPVPIVVFKEPPPPPPAGWQRPVGWASVLGGGALLAAGTWLTLSGLDRRDVLQTSLAKQENGLVIGSTAAEAHAEESAYRSQLKLGGTAIGLGVVAAAAGTWLLVKTPARQVEVAPVPAGLLLAWRWR